MHRSSPPPPPLPRRRAARHAGPAALRRGPTAPRGRRRGGFSFVEVLFAVVLLGLGFILIAAVFPVAISQSQTTMNETVGVSVTREAVRTVQSVANASMMVTTNNGATLGLLPFQTAAAAGTSAYQLQQAISGNQISTADPRYGWVGFYRRDPTGPAVGGVYPGTSYVQLVVVACKVSDPDRETYAKPIKVPAVTNPVVVAPSLIRDSTNVPVPVNVAFNYVGGGQPNVIALSQSVGGSPAPCDWADTGAFVIVATDAANAGARIGRILRLGPSKVQVPASTTNNQFYLDPAYDIEPADNGQTVTAYIVGRSLQYPTAAYGTSVLVGGVQDVACQSTYIPLN